MDKEKQVLELFNKYYEYVRTTDDGEQRGEWRREFARQIVKLFCQPTNKDFMCANSEKKCIQQCISCYSDEQCDSFWSKQSRPMSKNVNFAPFPRFKDDDNSKSPDL